MSFKKQFQVHFDECDPAGIVFFGNYFKLAHRGIEDFIVDSGITWKDWFQSKDFGVPLIHADADYKIPMFQGESYVANIDVTKIGESSISFETVFETLSGDVCSVVRTVHVFIDSKSMKKRPIPEDFRSKLETTL